MKKSNKSTSKKVNNNIEFLKIIDDLSQKLIGSNLINCKSNEDSTRIHINIQNFRAYTIFTENGYFIIDNDLKFNTLDFFKEYVTQILISKCKPEILDLYKKGFIDGVPNDIKDKIQKIDFSKITPKWFSDTFEEISEDQGNSETVENVVINNSLESFEISFDIDCDRYGFYKGNSISINNKGYVKTRFCEYLEGGDIDGGIKSAIERLILIDK